MNRRKAHRWGRLALLLASLIGGGLAVVALAGPWLPRPLAGLVPGDGVGAATTSDFAGLVSSACALALLGCWAWWALGAVVVAFQVLWSVPAPEWSLVWVPRTLRLLVPVLLGAAVTAAPASATSETGPHPAGDVTFGGARAVAGLPLPDRVVTPVPARRTVLVRPGDSLWRITERLLPASASVVEVDRGWRRIARANARHVPDPDLIRPGTRLDVPPLSTHPREEDS
jgi:nucleoid-associated protein YgaU